VGSLEAGLRVYLASPAWPVVNTNQGDFLTVTSMLVRS